MAKKITKKKEPDKTASADINPPLFNHQNLGWIFSGCSIFLIAFMGYFLLTVVKPMTEPSPYFKKISESYNSQIEGSEGNQPDKLTIDLAIILEYANADIRTAGVQIAFSLVSGLFFVIIGVLLFSAGMTGALTLSGRQGTSQFDMKTSTPGIACILLGASVIILGITKDTSRPLQAQVERALGVQYSQTEESPPVAQFGESSITDSPEQPEDKQKNRSDSATASSPK